MFINYIILRITNVAHWGKTQNVNRQHCAFCRSQYDEKGQMRLLTLQVSIETRYF